MPGERIACYRTDRKTKQTKDERVAELKKDAERKKEARRNLNANSSHYSNLAVCTRGRSRLGRPYQGLYAICHFHHVKEQQSLQV